MPNYQLYPFVMIGLVSLEIVEDGIQSKSIQQNEQDTWLSFTKKKK